jgi:hypothetical protein
MVKIKGIYFCPCCKLSTYHAIINESRNQLLIELLDNINPSKFSVPGILTCTECMNPNLGVE